MKNRRPELPHHDSDPPLRVVGQHAYGGAVVLDLALDDLAVGQTDAQREEPAPPLVQRLEVDEFGLCGRIRAYWKSSL